MESQEYCIKSRNGQSVYFTNYGASITKWLVTNLAGELDIVLGLNNMQSYKSDHPSLGSIVGRFANRISKGEFLLSDEKITLEKNDGENHLHGASSNFAYQFWNVNIKDEASIEFTLQSLDKDGGYPGKIDISVLYSFDETDTLMIEYKAISNQDTIINLTNHTYFNLNGESSGEVLDHKFQINASHFLPIHADSIPTGVIQSVDNTIMDLRKPRKLDRSMFEKHPIFVHTRAYDHNYVLSNNEEYALAAIVQSSTSNLKLECYTNKPGLQFYLGNFLDDLANKRGGEYKPHHGFCLESQFFPDSPNHSHFSDCILRKGETYYFKTGYRVSNQESIIP